MIPLDMSDLIKTLLTLLLGPGSIAVIWVAARAQQKGDKVPRLEAQRAKTVSTSELDTVADRWKTYADDIELRMGLRVSEQDERIKKLEEAVKLKDVKINGMTLYISMLQSHIYAGLGPPPPRPPQGLGNLEPTDPQEES